MHLLISLMMIIAMNVREALAESLLSFVFFYTACQFWWLWNPSYLLCQRKLFIIQLCPPTSFWYTENPNDTYQVSLTTFICLIIGISQGITLLLFLAGVLHVHTPHSCCYAGLRASQPGFLPPSAWFHHCCHSNSCIIMVVWHLTTPVSRLLSSDMSMHVRSYLHIASIITPQSLSCFI